MTIIEKNKKTLESSKILVILIFIFGFVTSLYFSQYGIYIFDQMGIFSAGYKIYNGKVPYKDFFLSGGLLISYLQALFFKIFGVNWLSYQLHAAVFNGLLAALSYDLLRRMGAKLLAIIGGLSLALAFYPSAATAYWDKHSFFFSFLALYFSYLALASDNLKTQKFYTLLTPLSVFLGFLCKPIPAAIVVPFIVVYFMLSQDGFGARFRTIKYMFVSSCFAIALFLLFLLLQGVDLEIVRIFSFEIPSSMGEKRLSLRRMGSPGYYLNFPFFYIFVSLNFIYFLAFLRIIRAKMKTLGSILSLAISVLFFSISVIILSNTTLDSQVQIFGRYSYIRFIAAMLLLFASFSLTFIVFAYKGKKFDLFELAVREKHREVQFAFYTFLFSYFFRNLTSNADALSMGLMPLWCSISLVPLVMVNSALYSRLRNLFYKLALLLIIFESCFFAYDNNFGQMRRLIPEDQSKALSFEIEGLESVDWLAFKTKSSNHDEKWLREIQRLYWKLKKEERSHVIFGGAFFISFFLGQPSVIPNVFSHQGIDIPYQRSEHFITYERKLIENIEKDNIELIIHIPEGHILEGAESRYFRQYKNLHKLIKKRLCKKDVWRGINFYYLCD